MGNFGGLLIIGVGIIVVIMGIKGTWQNLYPPNFFQNFLTPSSQPSQQFPANTPQFRIPKSMFNGGPCPQGWQDYSDSAGQWCVPSGSTSTSSTPQTTNV